MNIVTRFSFATLAGLGIALAAAPQYAFATADGAVTKAQAAPAPPQRLSDTGLFLGGPSVVRPGNLAYAPQYPLWSDGAAKRRWLYLPPGTSIDASDPDLWEFPRGTRLWKEFGHARPVETRFIERLADGSWQYATYVWNADGSDALLAPTEGIAGRAVPGAAGQRYDIPSRDDCRACHEGSAVPVLGVSALQLSPDRDLLAPHAESVGAESVDLRNLVALGLLSDLPSELLEQAPRIAAASTTARTALGYLHANCGHCHNDSGPLDVLDLVLAQRVGAGTASTEKVMRSLLGQPSEFRIGAIDTRIVAGRPGESVLAHRMRSRNPLVQMPPLGTNIMDSEGVALVERWIQQELQNQQEIVQ